MQTATSTYPCPFCFITIKDLKDRRKLTLYSTENLRTHGDLKKDFIKYTSLNKNKKLAKQCNSTLNDPIFFEDDTTCILEKNIIPELHILQGTVNHLFWDGLVPLLGREVTLKWSHK